MGSEEQQDLYLELLRNQNRKVDDMFQEIRTLQTGFHKVLELNCQIAQATSDLHSLQSELELLKKSVSKNAQDLIIPKFLERGVFVFLSIIITALVTMWVSRWDITQEAPLPVLSKSESDLEKIKPLVGRPEGDKL